MKSVVDLLDRAAVAGLVCLVAGCAQVSVHQLDPTLNKSVGSDDGVRYYMPKPYLLVASAPQDADTSLSVKTETQTKKQKDAGDAPGKTETATQAPKDSTPQTNAPTNSDTSFTLASKSYQVKLIYLPDREHPMALSGRSGLFGTASIKPTLQDGWMLTSLDGTSESKLPETLSSLASLLTAEKGGASTAKDSEKKDTGSSSKSMVNIDSQAYMRLAQAQAADVLRPGLYEFCFDATGVLTRLRAVGFFGNTGMIPSGEAVCDKGPGNSPPAAK